MMRRDLAFFARPARPGAALSRAGHHGASLLFALLTLAAMSLAAVALVRSVDTTSLVVGNLGFKQASVATSGLAVEAAITDLDGLRQTAKLDAVQAGSGYQPVAQTALDPTGSRTSDIGRVVADWSGDGCATPYASGSWSACIPASPVINLPAGNRAQYVITRLCASAGPAAAPTNSCAKPVTATLNEGFGRGGLGYPSGRGGTVVDPGPYYRIIVRIVGARNTVAYTETIVHF